MMTEPANSVQTSIPLLLSTYKGPALFCPVDKEPILNTPAARLATLDDRWVGSLLDYLRQPAESANESPPVTQIVPHSTTPAQSLKSAAPLFVLWSIIPVRQPGADGIHGDITGWLLIGNDITLENRMRTALAESRQRFKDLVEISSDFAWETDSNGDFIFISSQGGLGYSANDLVDRSSTILLEESQTISPFRSQTHITRAESWLKGASNQTMQVLISAIPVTDSDGRWKGTRGICVDITAARLREAELAQLRLRDQMIDRVVATLHTGDIKDSHFKQTAPALAHALSADASLIVSSNDNGISPVAHYGDIPDIAAERLVTDTGNLIVADDIGHWLLMPTHYRQQIFGGLALWRGKNATPWSETDADMLRRIAEHVAIAQAQISYQNRLLHLSQYDALTGLYNRRAFVEKIEERLARKGSSDYALLYLDLDNFKAVNDTNGHAKGDDVLRLVGKNLYANLRPGDLAGRLGGDEFAVWLERAPLEEARMVGERLLRIADDMRPLSASSEKPLGVSIGLTPIQGAVQIDAETLISRADGAMLASKKSGKGKLSILAPELSA